MILYVERKISAAHYLPGYDGKCGRLHGHTWRIEVWIEGKVNEVTGMLVDFKSVKDIIDVWDSHDLNHFLANPTAERMVSELLARFAHDLRGEAIESVRVRVWESDTCSVEDSVHWILSRPLLRGERPTAVQAALHEDRESGSPLSSSKQRAGPWWASEEGRQAMLEEVQQIQAEIHAMPLSSSPALTEQALLDAMSDALAPTKQQVQAEDLGDLDETPPGHLPSWDRVERQRHDELPSE